tara:strand:- start:10881 stop:11102 length:222 start_codon:yes stop_codon:yes gene_type:complete
MVQKKTRALYGYPIIHSHSIPSFLLHPKLSLVAIAYGRGGPGRKTNKERYIMQFSTPCPRQRGIKTVAFQFYN